MPIEVYLGSVLSTVRLTSKFGNCILDTVTGFFGVTCGLIKADTLLRLPSLARKSLGFFSALWASSSRLIAVNSSSSESFVPQLSGLVLRCFFESRMDRVNFQVKLNF